MDTPSRLLRLLSLLSSRASWNAGELSERLEVTERSVRRDITRLRGLGYPVESVTGPYGGYSLAAGGRLPPLLLDDDEAVSMAVALHQVASHSPPALAEAALSALTKLGQVLPESLRERIAALGAVAVGLDRRSHRSSNGPGDVESLLVLALACSRGERIRFDYVAGDDRSSARHVEPYRLVSVGHRWYLVANDLDRCDWRTFRVDRISTVRNTTVRFSSTTDLDAASFVAEGLAVSSYEQRALVRLPVGLARAIDEIPATIGVARADPDDDGSTLVEIGGDPDWIARYLASIEIPFELVDGPEVANELRRLGERLVAAFPPGHAGVPAARAERRPY